MSKMHMEKAELLISEIQSQDVIWNKKKWKV